jgi:hypothetical protein
MNPFSLVPSVGLAPQTNGIREILVTGSRERTVPTLRRNIGQIRDAEIKVDLAYLFPEFERKSSYDTNYKQKSKKI